MTGDTQNPSKDAQVEGVESALLAGVEGLGFTAVEQRVKYAGLVHLYLGADGKHRVVRDVPDRGLLLVCQSVCSVRCVGTGCWRWWSLGK